MAKIILEIDGESTILKIDGKVINDVEMIDMNYYAWEECYTRAKKEDLYFSYVQSAKNNDGEFNSTTRYSYVPAKASFDEGVDFVNPKSAKKENYERL